MHNTPPLPPILSRVNKSKNLPQIKQLTHPSLQPNSRSQTQKRLKFCAKEKNPVVVHIRQLFHNFKYLWKKINYICGGGQYALVNWTWRCQIVLGSRDQLIISWFSNNRHVNSVYIGYVNYVISPWLPRGECLRLNSKDIYLQGIEDSSSFVNTTICEKRFQRAEILMNQSYTFTHPMRQIRVKYNRWIGNQ